MRRNDGAPAQRGSAAPGMAGQPAARLHAGPGQAGQGPERRGRAYEGDRGQSDPENDAAGVWAGGTTGRAFRLSGHAGRLSYRDPCGSGGAAAADRHCRAGAHPGPSELVGAEGRAGLSGCRDRVLAYPDLPPAVLTGDARGLVHRRRTGSVGIWCVDDGGRQSRKPAAYDVGQPACGRQSGPDRRLPENGQRDEGGPALCPDHPAGWVISVLSGQEIMHTHTVEYGHKGDL